MPRLATIQGLTAACIAILAGGAAATAAAKLPADVDAFRRERDICEHFLGEEAYDAERGAYIRAQIERTCPGSDARLAALKRKYARSPAVLRALARYAPKIER